MEQITYLQNRNGLTDIENRLVVAKGKEKRVGMEWIGNLGLVGCKLLHLEWTKNEVILYSTGNYIQSFGIDHGGR